jgi:hypothetical protein
VQERVLVAALSSETIAVKVIWLRETIEIEGTVPSGEKLAAIEGGYNTGHSSQPGRQSIYHRKE